MLLEFWPLMQTTTLCSHSVQIFYVGNWWLYLPMWNMTLVVGSWQSISAGQNHLINGKEFQLSITQHIDFEYWSWETKGRKTSHLALSCHILSWRLKDGIELFVCGHWSHQLYTLQHTIQMVQPLTERGEQGAVSASDSNCLGPWAMSAYLLRTSRDYACHSCCYLLSLVSAFNWWWRGQMQKLPRVRELCEA